MGSTIEITVLNPLVDTCLMPHLNDVDFATTRPDTASFACELFRLGIHVIVVAEVGSEVVAKHPESRPQAIGGVGECDTRFNLAVLDSDLVLCIETCRCGRTTAIVLALGVQHQTGLARNRVVLYRHITRSVVLHLGIAATTGVVIDIPICRIDGIGIEIVFPNEGVSRIGLA